MQNRRRVILIEQPPTMWIEGGLVYVDFGLTNGNAIAFRPSVWFATSAAGRTVSEAWHRNQGQVINCCGGGH